MRWKAISLGTPGARACLVRLARLATPRSVAGALIGLALVAGSSAVVSASPGSGGPEAHPSISRDAANSAMVAGCHHMATGAVAAAPLSTTQTTRPAAPQLSTSPAVGTSTVIYGAVTAVGTDSFSVATGGDRTWTVDTTTATPVYSEPATSASTSTLSSVSTNEDVAVIGTIASSSTISATSVLVFPRTLAAPAPGSRVLFGDITQRTSRGFTLVTTYRNVKWTVNVSTSTSYMATDGTAATASLLSTGDHVAVMGIVTARHVISANGVFGLPAAVSKAAARADRDDRHRDARQDGFLTDDQFRR